MDASILNLLQTALELGLINGLTVLALFLSYSMLDVCDLSTDGCFTLGAAVGAAVAIAGHPYLAIAAAMAAGQELLHGQADVFLHQAAGRAGGNQVMLCQYVAISRAKLHHQLLFGVMCNQSDRHE